VEKVILTRIRETRVRTEFLKTVHTTIWRSLRVHTYFVCSTCQRRSRKALRVVLSLISATFASLAVFALTGWMPALGAVVPFMIAFLIASGVASSRSVDRKLRAMAVAEHRGEEHMLGWHGHIHTEIEVAPGTDYEHWSRQTI